MTDFMPRPTESPDAFAERLERMHPEIFRQLMPYISDMAEQIEQPEDLTEEELNALAYQAALDSGFLAQMPGNHNESTVLDIAKVLLLMAIYDRLDDDQPDPAVFPYWWSPYWYPGFFPWFAPWFGPGFRRRRPGGFRGRPGGGRPGGGRPGGGRPGGGRPGGGRPGGGRPGGGRR